ncbi:hypothetical protein MFMK1_000272 [Metallumcola ferriviriculae]|uniref:Glycosyltransferase 2-like domain-containing protein n=1 Tax=Metallumcola ferriviriculae TaxID=3039180 RepID=A0AAU0UJ25_9FIRM|nr:hypothetical protein MFMK1_000272 [Desulfitibacteraceae bacterium MK1]
MLAIVIPAINEAKHINRVIYNVNVLKPDLILPIINGCSDDTLNTVLGSKNSAVKVLHFHEPLGIDVPRALGALYAFRNGASRVIFVDGDMSGDFQFHLLELDIALVNGAHMALSNCYPYITSRHPLISMILQFRARLNSALGLYAQLGLASPSHGPHGITKELFSAIPTRELALPPVSLVLAANHGFHVKVATALPHTKLGSPAKGNLHSETVANTLIGDCVEGLEILKQGPRSRLWEGKKYVGYHNARRFDIIEAYLAKSRSWDIFRPRK